MPSRKGYGQICRWLTADPGERYRTSLMLRSLGDLRPLDGTSPTGPPPEVHSAPRAPSSGSWIRVAAADPIGAQASGVRGLDRLDIAWGAVAGLCLRLPGQAGLATTTVAGRVVRPTPGMVRTAGCPPAAQSSRRHPRPCRILPLGPAAPLCPQYRRPVCQANRARHPLGLRSNGVVRVRGRPPASGSLVDPERDGVGRDRRVHARWSPTWRGAVRLLVTRAPRKEAEEE